MNLAHTVCVPASAELRPRAHVRLTHDRMTAGQPTGGVTIEAARPSHRSDMNVLPRNALESALCLWLAALVPPAQRVPAQGRYARRGRYVTSNRPAFRRPAIG